MQTVVLFHNSKWYSAIWALLFALCLILLWFRRKQWKTGYDALFWIIMISVCILYCPIFANTLIPRFLPSFAEYERLAWIFFEIPLLSYVLLMLSKDFTKPRDRYLFISACLAILILFGGPDNRASFQKPQNRYKISQDALDICNKIDKLAPQGEIVLCVQLDSVNKALSGTDLDGTLYYGIRTYESRFNLRRIYVSPEDYKQDGFLLAEELPDDIDYYIAPRVENVYRELERLGYTYVDESENFAIFCSPNSKDS